MYRWRMLTAAVAVLSLLAVLAGGASAKSQRAAKFDPTCGAARTASRTVDGTLGSVTIHGTPKRIVALEFSFVDDLTQVGLKPIGIADDNNPAFKRRFPDWAVLGKLNLISAIANSSNVYFFYLGGGYEPEGFAGLVLPRSGLAPRLWRRSGCEQWRRDRSLHQCGDRQAELHLH